MGKQEFFHTWTLPFWRTIWHSSCTYTNYVRLSNHTPKGKKGESLPEKARKRICFSQHCGSRELETTLLSTTRGRKLWVHILEDDTAVRNSILIVLMVSWVYAYAQTYQIVDFTYVQSLFCQLHLNKDVKKYMD